jgi:hypothetical protein
MVCIDLPERKLDVELTEAELHARRKEWTAPPPRYTRGWLARYAAMVTNAGRGAVLDLPAARNGAETTSDSNGVAIEAIAYATGAAIEAITHSTRDRYRPKAGVSS